MRIFADRRVETPDAHKQKKPLYSFGFLYRSFFYMLNYLIFVILFNPNPMKAIYWFFISFGFLIKPGFTQITPPSSEDSSVVYFFNRGIPFDPSKLYNDSIPSSNPRVKYSAIKIDTTGVVYLYSNNKLIGKLHYNSYFRYECKAGNHLFWTNNPKVWWTAELSPYMYLNYPAIDQRPYPNNYKNTTTGNKKNNNNFVEAELAAGKVYFIKLGGDLSPVYPDNKLWVDGILHLISSKQAEVITQHDIKRYQIKRRKKIDKELYKFEERRLMGKLPNKLTEDMYYRFTEGQDNKSD